MLAIAFLTVTTAAEHACTPQPDQRITLTATRPPSRRPAHPPRQDVRHPCDGPPGADATGTAQNQPLPAASPRTMTITKPAGVRTVPDVQSGGKFQRRQSAALM